MIGVGVPSPEFNDIKGLKGSRRRRWGSIFDQHSQAKRSIKSKSAAAVDFVMRGWAVMNRPTSKETLTQALALFDQALSVDPHDVDPLAQIATTFVFEVANC